MNRPALQRLSTILSVLVVGVVIMAGMRAQRNSHAATGCTGVPTPPSALTVDSAGSAGSAYAAGSYGGLDYGTIPVSISPTTIILSWADSTPGAGCTLGGYRIYRGGTLIGTSGIQTFTDSSLVAGNTYNYYVVAYDVSGSVSAASQTLTVKTAAGGVVQGDANGDNRVNALDLSILISHDAQNYPAADFNMDGTIGSADLAILLGHWTW